MLKNVVYIKKRTANSAMMSTLTAHCPWEDEMARPPSSHVKAKKMKSPTFNSHGRLKRLQG